MQDGLEEIKQLFFEESEEGLDSMESGLLGLSEGEPDLDIINDIFRGAHSIKGGAATFSFTQIAEFTHHAETLLDQMRDGSRNVTSDCVELLLKGVDCIREMMDLARDGEDSASSEVMDVLKKIEQMHQSDPANSGAADSAAKEETRAPDQIASTVNVGAVVGWKIDFKPKEHFLERGNKPELLFRELSSLGELKIVSCIDDVPLLGEYEPQECYVSWRIELTSDCEKADVEEVFDWVDEDCELDIESIHGVVEEEIAEPTVAASENAQVEVTAGEEEKSATATKKSTAAKGTGSIRVGIDKIDTLLNLVGELVITQSMLKKIGNETDNAIGEKLVSGLSALESNARELQEVAMKMRMLPISNTFTRFPRMVHDLSKQLEKLVELEIVGEHTELDKTVLEKIGDPLVHLVRNALDHGIETPDVRLEAGKPATGLMKLSAAHEAGNIVIRIEDDGAGINPEKVLGKAKERGLVKPDETLSIDEINNLIFKPGFSTAEVVSDVSGRGVGMDVVRRNIQDLGGRVEIESEFGKGSTFVIRLPLTMAILDGQLVRTGRQTYIVPLLNIIESALIDTSRLSTVSAGAHIYRLREQNIPVIYTSQVFSHLEGPLSEEATARAKNSKPNMQDLANKILVVVDIGNESVGLVVDELLDQQQVVIKSLESNFRQLDGLSGATILGDGDVALILDLPGLVNQCYRQQGLSGSAKTSSNVEAA